MSQESPEKKSQLVAVLREGIGVIQMIVFKEVRLSLAARHTDKEPAFISMLSGAVINELFGSPSQEEKFRRFREENRALIEQELLAFPEHHPSLRAPLSDALRVQILCDSQDGEDSSQLLTHADELNILVEDRDIPLPSAFMTLVRDLGKEHNLLMPPVQIDPEQDQIIH